jgi:hypothetical protein
MSEITNLVSIEKVVSDLRAKLHAEGKRLDPVYTWTPETIAENLADLDEPVYRLNYTYCITQETAVKFMEYSEDFAIAGIEPTVTNY